MSDPSRVVVSGPLAAAAAQEKKAARSSKPPANPLTAAKRERDAQLPELTDHSHGPTSISELR